jgi:hypothetical protein
MQIAPKVNLPSDARAARPWSRIAWVSLETPWLTAIYWTTVALYIVAFWIPRFPPLVDYPQHLAIAALLRRWFDPSSPERQLYDVNLITYNGVFHLLTALLALVMSVENAGRVVLSLMPVALATGSIALLRAAERPRFYALLLVPLSMNGMVTWGFANNVLSYGVAFAAFAWVYRAMNGETRLYVHGALAGMVAATVHIFGAFFFCASAGLVALGKFVAPEPESTFVAKAKSFACACAALLPSALLSGVFVLHNRASSYSNWENAMNDGVDEHAWRKVVFFADLLLGNFPDHTDRRFFYMLAALIVFLYWPRRQALPSGATGHRALLWLSAFFFFLYLVTPRVLFATWFIFERIPLLVVTFLVAAAPAVSLETAGRVRVAAASLAIGTALNVNIHCARIPEEDDASALLDDIPPGRHVIGLIWEPTPWPVLERATWVHFQSYYLARKSGEMSPTFAFIESLPVHYKFKMRPPRPPLSLEWSPESYSVDEPYARHFETVIVVAPRNVADPAQLVFHEDAARAKVIAHHGRFWAFDASAIVGAEQAP